MTLPAISTNDAVDQLLQEDGPVWLLKHSNVCPTSFAALEQVENFTKAHDKAAVKMVVIQQFRPVSNYIAEVLGRVHQSPQLFLLKKGQVVWSASHWGISQEAMEKALHEPS